MRAVGGRYGALNIPEVLTVRDNVDNEKSRKFVGFVAILK